MQPKKDQGRGLAARQRHTRRIRPSPYVIEHFEPRLLLSSALPANHRAWEAVPGVIRNDGVETFVVEIEPGTAVNGISFTNTAPYLVAPPSTQLLDDGSGDDRVAGDGIYTSGPFRYKTSGPFTMPSHYQFDDDSPAGLFTTYVAEFTIEDTSGTTSRFLGQPSVGLLDKNIPLVQGRALASDVVTTSHFLNIRGDNKDTQKSMRHESDSIDVLTNRVYDLLGGDDYDFFMFVSTYKIEHQNWLERDNFTAGLHSPVQVNYDGTGMGSYDFGSTYGSDGRLLSLNFLDTYDRGMLSYNAVHEMLHQWGVYTDFSFGLNDGTAHYNVNTSVGSILGGTTWEPNGDGSFKVLNTGNRGGAYRASPLDLYLMGLIDASELPPIYVANPATFDLFKKQAGEPVLPSEIIDMVTADEIIARHGARTPGPAGAQKDFRIAFVGETGGRLMNPTELTYYQIMAEHLTKQVPEGQPDPNVEHNWAPITRFFGHGTTWRTDLTLPAPQTFAVAGSAFLDRNANGLRDANETGISGRTIFIDLDGDRVYDPSEVRAITAADGSWSLAQLDPGTYNVCQATINGFTVIAPDDRCHTITLTDAGLADLDFANFPTRFEGTSGDDHFYLRLDPSGVKVELYLDGGLAGEPAYTFAPATLPAYTIMGRDGDDLLTVDLANGNPFPSLAVLFFGDGDTAATGGPGDRLEVLGAGLTFGSGQSAITLDGKGVGYNLIEQIIIKDGTYNFTTPVPLTGLRVDASATATFAGLQVFTTLDVEGDASVVPGANTIMLAVSHVAVADGATLDLQDSDLIVQATPETRQAVLDSIVNLIRRSRNASPRWSGTGITSSLLAGDDLRGLVATPNDNGSGTPLILNHPLLSGPALNNQMILVRRTYNGDANFDAKVNADDYFLIDSGFLAQSANPAYRDGDFNYDATVNADDYFLIDSAFLGQAAVAATPPAAVTASSASAALAVNEGASSITRAKRAPGDDQAPWNHKRARRRSATPFRRGR